MNENQRGRRNLSPAWKVELELGNKADLLEIGRTRNAETVGRPSNKSVSQNDSDLYKPKHSTRVEIAKVAGVEALSQNDKPPIQPVNTRKEIAKAAGVSTGQVGKRKRTYLTSVRFLLDSIHASADLPEIIHGAWRLVLSDPARDRPLA